MKSVNPGLAREGISVHHLPIEPLKVRAAACGSDPETRIRRGHDGVVEIELSIPPVRFAELVGGSARGPRRDWRLAPAVVRSGGMMGGLPGLTAFHQNNSGMRTSQSSEGRGARQSVVVRDALDRIRLLPHRLRGLMPHEIRRGEIDSHLNEVRAARGLKPQDAMLLMVFRRAPVELISHMRVEQRRKLLFYRLVPCEGLSCTRVYDLAAIRDLSTGQLHLVPHRTRNRIVSLSRG